jgi:hypothetical protein
VGYGKINKPTHKEAKLPATYVASLQRAMEAIEADSNTPVATKDRSLIQNGLGNPEKNGLKLVSPKAPSELNNSPA